MRTLSQVIGDAFFYVWFFVGMVFLFRPYQLKSVKRKLILVAFVLFCVSAVYRVVLQVFGISHSRLSVTQKISLNIISLSSICWKVYLLKKLHPEPVEESDFMKLTTPYSFTFFVGIFIASFILSNVQQTNWTWKTPYCTLLTSLRSYLWGSLTTLHLGYSYILLVPLYFGSAVMFWVMQAELENLKFIAVLGIIHGALEDLVSYIFHVILKRKSAPWGSFRTPRRERLMADIVIISMFSESIGIVCVNGLLYVYQFIYLQNISLLKLVQKFVINTSVPLVIEWLYALFNWQVSDVDRYL